MTAAFQGRSWVSTASAPIRCFSESHQRELVKITVSITHHRITSVHLDLDGACALKLAATVGKIERYLIRTQWIDEHHHSGNRAAIELRIGKLDRHAPVATALRSAAMRKRYALARGQHRDEPCAVILQEHVIRSLDSRSLNHPAVYLSKLSGMGLCGPV